MLLTFTQRQSAGLAPTLNVTSIYVICARDGAYTAREIELTLDGQLRRRHRTQMIDYSYTTTAYVIINLRDLMK